MKTVTLYTSIGLSMTTEHLALILRDEFPMLRTSLEEANAHCNGEEGQDYVLLKVTIEPLRNEEKSDG